MKSLVSIIVPVYKVEQYLSKCVDSLLSQSYGDIEIILVDDGSSDFCGVMCDGFAERDGRIKVIHKKNGGLSDARNAGLAIASGDFITYVDSDDYVSEKYIEKLLQAFENDQVDISVCGIRAFCLDDQGNEQLFPVRQENGTNQLFDADRALEIMLRQSMFDTEAWAKMYRASLMDGFLFPVGLYNEDLDSVYKLFLKSDKVSFTDEKLYYYLQRKDSIMGRKREVKRYHDSFEIADRLRTDICNQRPDLEKAVNSRVLSVYFQSYAGAVHCDDSELAEECWNRIKELRAGVMTDPKGRPKARGAAMISLLGRKAFIAAYDTLIRK
ncbi:MAG: glycosyltransferase [Oscillospiraceae bacterium]|nr:glycosyltransferase [Oscillospiraceae bacterium]